MEQPLGVLGSWITAPADLYPDGEVNYKPVTDAIMDKLTVKCRALTGVIGYLPKQVGLLALRTCCLPILQHVIRTTPEGATLPACRKFDDWVENRLLNLARLAGNTEYGKNIAHLPLREGGLGLLSQEIIAPFAYGSSYVTSWRIILANAPALARDKRRYSGLARDISGMLYEQAVSALAPACLDTVASLLGLESADDLWDPVKFPSTKQLQHRVTKAWGYHGFAYTFFHPETSLNLQQRMLDWGNHLGRAWMYRMPHLPTDWLSNQHVSLALAHRLGCNFSGSLPADQREFCPKHPEVPFTVEHGLACNRVEIQALRSKRHTDAKYTICRHARRALDAHPDGAVHMEARLSDPERPNRQLAMDLVLVGLDPAQVIWADVSFAAPLQSCRSPHGTPMSREVADALVAERNERRASAPNRAAHAKAVTSNPLRLVAIDHIVKPAIRARHKEKLRYYTRAVRATTTHNPRFTAPRLVPLVFSAGGTPSPDSTKILKMIIDKSFAKQAENIAGNGDPDLSHINNAHDKARVSNSLYYDISIRLVRNLGEIILTSLMV